MSVEEFRQLAVAQLTDTLTRADLTAAERDDAAKLITDLIQEAPTTQEIGLAALLVAARYDVFREAASKIHALSTKGEK